MSQSEIITWPVPEGFPKMSLPTNPETRFPSSEILLRPAQESDLLEIAAGLYKYFPQAFWDEHEPQSRRPNPKTRTSRLVARFKPLLTHHPNFKFLVARIKSTGEFAGAAGWHTPVEGAWSHNMWLCDMPEIPNNDRTPPAAPQVGWQSGYPWKADEIPGLWEGVDLEAWATTWAGYDRVRREEMGEEPHWYLAPFFVEEKFRGRGVGRLLLQWAIEKADAVEPPVPLYLEAFPNARPVYIHVGFEPREGPGRELVVVRRGPAGSRGSG